MVAAKCSIECMQVEHIAVTKMGSLVILPVAEGRQADEEVTAAEKAAAK